MAGQFDVNIVSTEIGALSNAIRPLFKVPSAGGGITVLDVNFSQAGAGTTALNLVNLGSGGTSVAGTIASKGSAVYAANVPQSFTLVDGFVDGGEWVGIQETNVGAANTVSIISLSYVMGK